MSGDIIIPVIRNSNPELINLKKGLEQSKLDQKSIINLITVYDKKLSKGNRAFENTYFYWQLTGKLKKIDYLKEKYILDFLEDMIYKFIIKDLSSGLSIREYTKQTKSAFCGLIFESFIVRKINSDENIKKNVYKWIMDAGNLPSSKTINQFEALALGAQYAKKIIPDEASETDKIDVIFIDKSNARKVLMNSSVGRRASFQLKAGKSNKIISEIVNSIVRYMYFQNGKSKDLIDDNVSRNCYRKILTLLTDKNGVHTKERVLSQIKKNLIKYNLSSDDYIYIEENIKSPQDLGLDQKEINDYFEFIGYVYDHPDEFKEDKIMSDHAC